MIKQTAGRDALGTFAPQFAHYNDDILFGENWNDNSIDLKKYRKTNLWSKTITTSISCNLTIRTGNTIRNLIKLGE